MNDVTKQGRTVLFVSHNMPIVKNLCTRGLYLKDGYIEYDGTVGESINQYMGYSTNADLDTVWTGDVLKEYIEGKVEKQSFIDVKSISVMNDKHEPCSEFISSEKIIIKFDFEIKLKPGDFRIVVSVLNKHNEPILSTQIGDKKVHNGSLEPGMYCVCCEFPENTFGTDLFILRTEFLYVKKEHLVLNGCPKFRVKYD